MLFVLYRYSQDFISLLEDGGAAAELHIKRTMPFSGANERHQAAVEQLKSGALKPAATVDCNPDDLFRVTNAIDCPWVENEEVLMFDENAFLSSTSVGDVIKAGDGNFYMVENTGYSPLHIDDLNGQSYPLPNKPVLLGG